VSTGVSGHSVGVAGHRVVCSGHWVICGQSVITSLHSVGSMGVEVGSCAQVAAAPNASAATKAAGPPLPGNGDRLLSRLVILMFLGIGSAPRSGSGGYPSSLALGVVGNLFIV
jgi:hypothetical protein